ncbi:MAG: hypothetical protein ACE5LC_06085 [Candidatus Aminicenantales bacterium]
MEDPDKHGFIPFLKDILFKRSRGGKSRKKAGEAQRIGDSSLILFSNMIPKIENSEEAKVDEKHLFHPA